MAEKDIDLVSKLTPEERVLAEHRLKSISPDDGKYAKASMKLVDCLSAEAEWRMCAEVQFMLLYARKEFKRAEQRHVDELKLALPKFSPLNAALLEEKVTKHDQLAVLEELGRYISEETKALLHPGTTSYDVLDTARAFLFQKAWFKVMRPEISKSIGALCGLSEKSKGILQVGRTHLQDTSPVPFETTLASYAARFAERLEKCDGYFLDLRGKVSGIVGTGASIDQVIGEGKSLEFERAVLDKFGLKPDYTATQITQKERLADVGNGLATLMTVLADFANDVRMMYSSALGEVTSRDNAARLGGSSADATKNNPIEYENMAGKAAVVESGMRVLYEMIKSDLQRDLRNSVQGRYQPNAMMVETLESFSRLNRALSQFSINEDRVAKNLEPVRRNPSEAMVAILRGAGWSHSKYGVGHDFVKEIGKQAKKRGFSLRDVAMEDPEFLTLYEKLPEVQRAILRGELENYTGSAHERAEINRAFARNIVDKYPQNPL